MWFILAALILGSRPLVAANLTREPSPGEIPAGLIIDRKFTPRAEFCTLLFKDAADPRFHAWADLDRGTLVFFIRARIEEERSRVLFGRDIVRVALHEFGPRVRRIEGRWSTGDNRIAFDAARNAGASRRRAAAQTWTARVLKQRGFAWIGRVRTERLYEGQDQIYCHFRRPPWRTCALWLSARLGRKGP